MWTPLYRRVGFLVLAFWLTAALPSIRDIRQSAAAGDLVLQMNYITQYEGPAVSQNSDCGPTAVAMVVDAYGKRPAALAGNNTDFIKDVRQRMKNHRLALGNGDTRMEDLVNAIQDYGISYQYTNANGGDQFEAIKAALMAHKPVIALIQGDAIGRLDSYVLDKKTNTWSDVWYSGHWIILKGISADGTQVYVNDPDGRKPTTGRLVRKQPDEKVARVWEDWTATHTQGGDTTWPTDILKQALQLALTKQGYTMYGIIVGDGGLPQSAGANGSVTVTVRRGDSAKSVVPGATVTFQSNGVTNQLTTNQKGQVTFQNVPIGRAQVKASHSNFGSGVSEVSITADSNPASVDVTLVAVSALDIALIIDSSGSMAITDPNDLRKEAAKLFTQALEPQDQLTIIDFDTYARPIWSIQPVGDLKAPIREKIDTIDSAGLTDISGGLREAYMQLNNGSSDSKIAILLTDGYQEGTSPYDPFWQHAFADKHWPVYTFALSSNADTSLLSDIARETHGVPSVLNQADDLQALYNALRTKLRGTQPLLAAKRVMQPGNTWTASVYVPSFASSATFVTTWPGSSVETVIQGPDGIIYTPTSDLSDVDHVDDRTFEIYQIQFPLSGEWKISAYGADLAPGGENVTLQADASLSIHRGFIPLAGISSNNPVLPSSTPTHTPVIGGPTNTPTSTPTSMPTSTPTSTPTPTQPPAAITQIAFISLRDGNLEVYAMNPDGSNQRRLTSTTADEGWPGWSADGSLLTFWSARDGNREIYAMNADGSNQRRLTSNAADDEAPAWSPDGRTIAFQSNRDGNFEIYAMNADGSNQRRLTSAAGDDRIPAWSPDGRFIAFTSARNGKDEIYVMNADGSNQMDLTNNSSNDRSPAWSPDGRTIAFHSDRDGNFEIYAMNADGSNQRRLTSNAADDRAPAWSPDGGKIAFLSDRSGSKDIFVMNADGSSPVNISNHSADDQEAGWWLR